MGFVQKCLDFLNSGVLKSCLHDELGHFLDLTLRKVSSVEGLVVKLMLSEEIMLGYRVVHLIIIGVQPENGGNVLARWDLKKVRSHLI
jgi:hypothetical protein